MSLLVSDAAPVVLGSQVPTLACYPPERVNYDIAEATIDLAATAGLFLDDFQKMSVREIMVQTADGRPAAFEAAVIVSRQNGKNVVLEACELGWMFLMDLRLTIHSAHRVDTSQEHYLRMKELIEGCSALSRRLYPEYRGKSRSFVDTNGKEGIKLKKDRDHPFEVRLLFKARAHGGSRGFTGDRLVLDEAYDLPARMIGNAVPALRARPAAQVVYTSSPPHYTSEHVHALIRRAREHDPTDRLFVAAWLNDPDTRLDDEEAWARANPALGTRIDIESVRQELRMMRENPELRAEFMRECCGIPEGGDGESGVVPFDKWLSLKIEAAPRVDSVQYGLAASPDGSWAAVGSAGRLPSGALYVDKVEYQSGTGWVVEYVAGLCKRKRTSIRVDPAGAEGAFIRELRDCGVEVVEVSPRLYQQACGEFLAAVTESSEGRPLIAHIDQRSLNRAVAAATRREVGQEGGWVWSRPGMVDISPLKAATVALSGVQKRRAPRIHVLAETS